MPTENELRDLFSAERPPNTLDPQAIIARSRARRRPRQLAAATVGALAIAGVSVLAVQTSLLQPPASVMMDQGSEAPGDSSGSTESAIARAPADRLNLCEGGLAEVAPSAYGLQLDVAFPATAPVGADAVSGTVRLTNAGTEPVSGYTAARPAITLSQDGVVLWHSNGPTILTAVILDLAPGESVEYLASFAPVRCSVEDDDLGQFRDELPAVPAGEYQLSAAIDFTPDAAADSQDPPAIDLVTGPPSSIELGQ